MGTSLVLAVIIAYFFAVFLVSHFTARGANNATFFRANKQSRWYVVAFGMIGASLSGVTFISVPGWVKDSQFSYMQMVLGYMVGYAFIALVLLPLYYRLNLTSIYTYLESRLGFWAYKTGAFFFLLSRTIGAAFRLFLVVGVLQLFLFDDLGMPFWFTTLTAIALIWLYTFRGGINTVVWTDTFQTAAMLLAVTLTCHLICKALGFSFSDAVSAISKSAYAQVFNCESGSPYNFWRQFSSGAFIAIVMTGLDQDMMQKNLTCKSLGEAQKNMFSFSIVLVFVNLLFLSMGALLYIFANRFGLSASGDQLYPFIAKEYLGTFGGVVFLLGVIAAAYSSADSALTSLTTSFCIDFLDFGTTGTGEATKRMRRIQVHLAFSVLLFIVVLVFKAINDESVIAEVFKAAGYTYGPLLGLFAFGLFTPWKVRDQFVPVVCLLSPLVCWVVNHNSAAWFDGYVFGFELLLLNGAITFIGLIAIKSSPKS